MKTKLTKIDLKRIVRRIIKEQYSEEQNNEGWENIVTSHIERFVGDTLDNFIDVMSEMTDELNDYHVFPLTNFTEAEMHFEKELFILGGEIIHAIHQDIEMQHKLNSGNSGGSNNVEH